MSEGVYIVRDGKRTGSSGGSMKRRDGALLRAAPPLSGATTWL